MGHIFQCSLVPWQMVSPQSSPYRLCFVPEPGAEQLFATVPLSLQHESHQQACWRWVLAASLSGNLDPPLPQEAVRVAQEAAGLEAVYEGVFWVTDF